MDRSRRTKLLQWFHSLRRLKGNTPAHRRRRKIWLFSVCILAVCTACGDGSSSSSSSGTISIAISPQTVTLPVSTSAQFSATVSNSSNTDVTWQVNDTTGGSATYGTISSSGLYTAPSPVPSNAITVKAIAKADTSKTATATVTVTNANTLVVTPAQATVPAGGQQTFTATLGGNAVDANWSVSCKSTDVGGCGTVSLNGVYTAPLSPPLDQSVTVVASSKNNTANAANATVDIVFGTGTLVGQYSFAVSGLQSGQPFSAVGSIRFDGKGGIAGGTEDRLGQATPVAITGGSYSTDSGGRVTATIHTDSGDEGWQITLITHSRAVVMRVDSVVAQGELDLQDTAQFGHTFNGNFSFHVAGKSVSGAIPASTMVGALVFDQQGNVTSGVVDSNDGGAVSTNVSASGTSTASSSTYGRGTLSLSTSLGTQTFAYYVLDSTTAKLIETDGGRNLLGKLVWRTSSSTVNTSHFAGSYAFIFKGANSAGTIGQGGTFVVDLNGNITNGTFDMATDTAFALGFLFSGSLVVADPVSGRSIVTVNVGGSTLRYVVYPPDLNYQLAFLEIDGNNVASGHAFRHDNTVTGGSIPSVSGQYGLIAGEATNGVRRTISGIVTLASTPTGVIDVDDGGNVTLDRALQNSSFSVTSLYGRGSLQLQAGTYNASYTTYIVDSRTVLLMETDGKGVLTGIMQKQH